FVRRVPALKDLVKLRRLFSGDIALEPGRFHDAAAERRRLLLVLSGEVILPHGQPQIFENLQWLSLWVKRFTCSALHRPGATKRDDLVGFVLFRDGRQSHKVPVFLLQDVSDQVVFMEALRNKNDAALALVIQPAEDRVVEPFVDRLAPGWRNSL